RLKSIDPCSNERPTWSAACQVQHGSRDGHLAKPPAGHIFIHSDWGPALDPHHTTPAPRALWLVLPVHPAGRREHVKAWEMLRPPWRELGLGCRWQPWPDTKW